MEEEDDGSDSSAAGAAQKNGNYNIISFKRDLIIKFVRTGVTLARARVPSESQKASLLFDLETHQTARRRGHKRNKRKRESCCYYYYHRHRRRRAVVVVPSCRVRRAAKCANCTRTTCTYSVCNSLADSRELVNVNLIKTSRPRGRTETMTWSRRRKEWK